MTTLIILLVALIIAGVALQYAPMEPGIKKITVIAVGCIVFIVLLVFALNATGVLHAGLPGVQISHQVGR